MISVKQKGNFDKTENWLKRISKNLERGTMGISLENYGERGVEALRSATPVDSGLTRDSWYYRIDKKKDSVIIGFYNTNINEGVNIAVILQYGHGTGTGGYVEGIDYINPALRPIFEDIAEDAWEEIRRV